MRVLFLHSAESIYRDGRRWYYDDNLATLAACLRTSGHDPRLFVVVPSVSAEDARDWVHENRATEPGQTLLVICSSLAYSAQSHDRIVRVGELASIGLELGCATCCVGVAATMEPRPLLGVAGIDFVGRGEMDRALPAICDRLERGLDIDDLTNVATCREGVYRENPLRPLEDLDTLPLPARDLLPPAEMANECDGILTVLTTRGCSLSCNFCPNTVLQELHGNAPGYARQKSFARVLREIDDARRHLRTTSAVFFQDDVFANHHLWADEFLARYPTEVGIPFGCNLTVKQVTVELAERLAAAGARQVQLGVESGDPFLRNRVLEKDLSQEELERAVGLCQANGLRVKFFVMTGLPGETRRRYRSSVRNIARTGAEMVNVQVWVELHGGPLRSDRARVPGQGVGALRQRMFHRLVAAYCAIERRAGTEPLRARAARAALSAVLTAPLGLRVLDSRLVRRLVRSFAPSFIDEVIELESRLASVVLWPANDGEAPSGPGWRDRARVDLRHGAGV